jgi:hypothetical protein
MYKLIKIEENQPEQVSFFTEEQINAIYDALGDYADYGEYEDNMAYEIKCKL